MADASTAELAEPTAGLSRPRLLGVAALAFAGLFAAGALVAYSFHVGTTGGNHSTMFAAFWAGMLAGLLPLVTLATAGRTATWLRVVALLGVAAVTTLPKVLRSPDGPLFHDEYAHLRAVNDVLTTGQPGGFNSLVAPIPYFPGLHLITAAVSKTFNVTAWHAGTIVVSLAHLAGLVAVFALARALGLTGRGAGIAAVVYATNANWMYFHSQFSYESFALPIVLSLLALVAWAVPRYRQARWPLVVALLPAGYAVATVHHLSALGFLALLLAMTLAVIFTSRSVSMSVTMCLVWLAAATGVVWRLTTLANLLMDYLGSPVQRGITHLMDGLFGRGEASQAHKLFANSIAPLYERLAGFAGPPMMAAATLALLWVWWTARRASRAGRTPEMTVPAGNPMRVGLLWFGMLYFASLPLMLTSTGNEGGRRSWGYSMVGLSVLVGLLFDTLATRGWSPRTVRRTWTAGMLAWTVLLVGGVATGVNVLYRFPLPQTQVSDLTAATAETVALGDWFKANADRNTWVLTDRYSGMAIASAGGMQVAPASRSFPWWEIYYDRTAPQLSTMAKIRALGAEYIVVDHRMTDTVVANGWWLGPDEPLMGTGEFPATEATLAKFDYLPWLIPVYASEHYSVYRFDLSRYNPDETDRLIEEHQSWAV